MRKVIIYIILTWIVQSFLFCNTAFSQGAQFSQFNNTPSTLNPALIGGFAGDYRFTLNHRSQWSIFETTAFSYDMILFKKKLAPNHLGLGASFLSDKAGVLGFGSTQGAVSIAAHILLSPSQRLSAGIKGAYSQRGIHGTDLRWDSQFDGVGYQPDIPSGEIANETFSVFDASAGVLWHYERRDASSSGAKLRINTGLSLAHINSPIFQYGLENSKLPMKITFHGDGQIGFRRNWFVFKPAYMISIQDNYSVISAGGVFRFITGGDVGYSEANHHLAISAGGYCRWNDAYVFYLAFEKNGITVSTSYDVNMTDVKQASMRSGAMELSLSYIIKRFKVGKFDNIKFL